MSIMIYEYRMGKAGKGKELEESQKVGVCHMYYPFQINKIKNSVHNKGPRNEVKDRIEE